VSKAALLAVFFLAAAGAGAEETLPRYRHIFLIIEESHGFDEIIGNRDAPMINRLAKAFGLATNFSAEARSSEANHVALLAGDSFGIRDDDAYWCKPGAKDSACPHADSPDYVAHTVTAKSLLDQLTDQGLTWKGYFQDIPAAGFLLERSVANIVAKLPAGLYTAQHNGLMNFKAVQQDPNRADKIVALDQLPKDLAANQAPSFAEIIPNQCDNMHGLEEGASLDCRGANQPALISRADALVARTVQQIMNSPLWKAEDNAAIIITWDHGGRVPTIVITNHGARAVSDPTPYGYHSLLRTIEAAFGMSEFVGHAGDNGVVSMTPLFAAH